MSPEELKRILKVKYKARTDRYRASEKYRMWAQAYYSRPDVISRRRENEAKRYERRKAAKIGGGG